MFFADNHVWMSPIHDNIVKMGLSSMMRENLGEIVHIDLPSVDKYVRCGDILALLESSKAAIEVLTPLEGTIIQVNDSLRDSTDAMNDSPEEEGWLVVIKLATSFNPKDFLTKEEYESAGNRD